MKTKKRILAYLLTLTLAMTSMPTQLFAQITNDLPLPMSSLVDTQTTTPGAIQINPTKYVGDGYEVEFKVTNQWTGAFNGEFVLTNTSDKPLENWTLKFDFEHEISNMWNAQIVSYDDGNYVIKNMGWNQDIEPGSSVTIGFQANSDGNINNPSKYSLDMEEQVASDVDYTIGFKLIGNWNSGFNGEISITNQSKAPIEDWSLAFDFEAKINNLWTATIVDHTGNHYVIKNKGYNANIEPGQTLTLGFGGGNLKDSTAEPSNYKLFYIGSVKEKEEIDYELDSDNDDLPDYYENILGTDPLNADTDGDSIPDGYEYWELMTDPLLLDSDGNNISDADEDFDKDGLPNKEEFLLGTNPYDNDTDKDGLLDGDEVNKFDTNPLVYDKIDENLDTDQDGLVDGLEMRLGTELNNPDTDGEGLLDGYEVFTLGTNPLEGDSDHNGINDGDEDLDSDGLTNLVEQKLGTDPQVADTDKDNLSDGDEVNQYHTDPLIYDTDGDTIGDGDEIKIGLNPLKSATNGVPDNEYTFEQEVSEEALKFINTEENAYELSIDMIASGNAADNIIVSTSQQAHTISGNDAIVGTPVSIDYSSGIIEEGTLYFQLKEEVLTEESKVNDIKLQGLKRYYVFNYNQEIGMLVPVPTTYNDNNGTIVTEMIGTGTYCVIDLEKWFLDIGVLNENIQTYSESTRMSLNSTSTFIDQASMNSANARSLTSGTFNTKQNKVDLVFVVETGYTMESIMKSVKTGMKQIIETLEAPNIDLQVSIIDLKDVNYFKSYNPIMINGISAIEAEGKRELSFTNSKEEMFSLIDSLDAYGGYDRQIAATPLAGLGYVTTLPFRADANKFTLLITDKSYSATNYHGFKTVFELLDVLKQKNISLSISTMTIPTPDDSLPDMTVQNYKRWITRVDGVFVLLKNFTDNISGFTDYVLAHLIEQDTFMILKSNSLEEVILSDPLIKGGSTDSDGDGLTDSEEVNWGNEFTGTNLIKITADGYELPTLNDLWGIIFIKYDYDCENFPYADRLDQRVLPLLSDPTEVDSDDDGLLDKEDTMPFIDDFKELWYKMTINEKEFYIGHTGYGINSTQAHIYDHSNDSWQHYGLIDGIWLFSDKAKQIKREIDDIKDLVGFEEEEIAFEHPDEDVVIDLDEVLGTCRGVIEGYDSFIEDIKADNRDELDTVLGIFIGFIDCYFDEHPELINAKSTGKVKLDIADKKKAAFKMMTPDLDEVKSFVLFLLDENEEELEQSITYLEVKVTTDKACTFGFSIIGGASAIVGAAQLIKGAGEVTAGVASAPETGGASIAIAAKGGVSLKKAVEKIDLACKYIKKAENAFEQYNIDDKKYDEFSGYTDIDILIEQLEEELNSVGGGLGNPATYVAKELQQMNADKILSNSKCPNTIAVLKMPSGDYRIGYNSQGIYNEEIQEILDELGNVNKYNRQCAEVNVLSSAYGGEGSLQGAEIYVTYLFSI